jgi:hypothetical protein
MKTQISPTNAEDEMLIFKFSDSDQFGAKSKKNDKCNNNIGEKKSKEDDELTKSKEDDELTKCFNKSQGPLSSPFSSGSGISFGWNFWPPPPAYAAVLSEDDNDVKYNTNLFFKRSCSSSAYCEKLDSKLTGDDNEDEIDIDSI